MDEPEARTDTWARRTVRGVFCALLGALVGMIVAGAEHAALGVGAAFGAAVGFALGFVFGLDLVEEILSWWCGSPR